MYRVNEERIITVYSARSIYCYDDDRTTINNNNDYVFTFCIVTWNYLNGQNSLDRHSVSSQLKSSLTLINWIRLFLHLLIISYTI